MKLEIFIPDPPLNEFIERFWLCTNGSSERNERILPSGTVELVINLNEDQIRICTTAQQTKRLSGIAFSGTYPASFLIDARQHSSMMGVHFWPGGAYAILNAPLSCLTAQHLDAELIWGSFYAQELRERLCLATTSKKKFLIMEDALNMRLSMKRIHPATKAALHAFQDRILNLTVRDVIRNTGLSKRRFIQLFTEQIGLTPKLFCRILRFQRARLISNQNISWSEIAQQCGYSDQSHLINEFQEFMSMTPSLYLKQERYLLEHNHQLLRNHVPILNW